jgi:hypothetical protein
MLGEPPDEIRADTVADALLTVLLYLQALPRH